MQPMNHNSSMEPNTMNALAQMNQMNDMQQGSNPMAKMQGMANGYVSSKFHLNLPFFFVAPKNQKVATKCKLCRQSIDTISESH